MSTKETLLEITQTILQEINSDEVNSIVDTEDSEQVAKIIRSTYRALMTKNEWPHTRRALTVEGRSDSNFPTHMRITDDLKELGTISYNIAKAGEERRKYKEIKYLSPDDFLRKLNVRDNTADDTVIVIDDSGIELLIKNDKAPEFYTSFDDENMVFDSWDSAVEATLHKAKFQASGYVIPEFLMEDNFVPDLPSEAFPLLQEKATARAQLKMRQMTDASSEREAAGQSRKMSRANWAIKGGITYPNYGR